MRLWARTAVTSRTLPLQGSGIGDVQLCPVVRRARRWANPAWHLSRTYLALRIGPLSWGKRFGFDWSPIFFLLARRSALRTPTPPLFFLCSFFLSLGWHRDRQVPSGSAPAQHFGYLSHCPAPTRHPCPRQTGRGICRGACKPASTIGAWREHVLGAAGRSRTGKNGFSGTGRASPSASGNWKGNMAICQ